MSRIQTGSKKTAVKETLVDASKGRGGSSENEEESEYLDVILKEELTELSDVWQ